VSARFDANDPRPLTRVAVAIIERVHQGEHQVLFAQRPVGKAYAGYWEFPGGKIEPGETAAQALVRELHEELGIEAERCTPWITREHVYPHAHVRLHFFRVAGWRGEIRDIHHDALAWQHAGRVDVEPMLPANVAVLRGLTLQGSGDSHDTDDACLDVRGNRNVIENLVITDCLFGIDLKQSNGNLELQGSSLVHELPLGLRGDMRLGLALEAGRIGRPYTQQVRDGWLQSVALYVGGETPLGPAYLGVGRGLGGAVNAYLFVGTP